VSPKLHLRHPDRDQARAEMYRRFSRRGLHRQRLRRLMRGVTWVLMVQSSAVVKRTIDFGLACTLLLLLSPCMVTMGLLLRIHAPGFQRTHRVGRWYETFQ
jgi:lipopolysaccharide/colanic/teichoic acid biosynthesis glycosyltransferase